MIKLFTMLGTFPATFFGYFLALFGRKYTVATASVLAFLATTVAMVACLKTILAAIIALIVMPTWIATFIAWFIPSNFVSVMSAIISGRICKTVYNLVNRKIELINQAS